MERTLSEKKYRNSVHKNKSVMTKSVFSLPIIKHIVVWFHNWELYSICKKYFKKDYKNIFEVWCAPWNYLIQFHKIFWLFPNGIEYTKDGFDILKKNFRENNITSNLIYWDFFDKQFLTNNKEKYDITYSLWFIEHFSNPKEAIENHFTITKKWGLVVLTMPNLYYLNKYLTEKGILNIHNLSIMNLDVLRNSLLKEYNILELKYFGGLFNIGQFSYRNKFLETIRFILFVFQRILIDPLFILLSLFWISLSNKYSSPSIIVICKKN